MIFSYYDKFVLPGGRFKMAYARADPTVFANYMLGFVPRDYQDSFFQAILGNRRVVVVKGRQLGFSTCVALFSFWAAWFNKFPSGSEKNTKIGIISKEDDAAKKVLMQVRNMIYAGDARMSGILKGRDEWTNHFFSGDLVEPNNSDTISFKNGCFIKSYPPTDKVRGNSFDVVFIDEAAFLRCENPDSFFFTVIEPTTVATGGRIVALSTPNGQSGFFFNLVDPFELKQDHFYKRLNFPFSINSDAAYKVFINDQKRIMDVSDFEQEYNCNFNASKVNFFIPEKVDAAVDDSVSQADYHSFDMVAGVDFGMTDSRTVISLATLRDSKIVVPRIVRFCEKEDVNHVIPYLQALKQDGWNIVSVVADDCPQGDAIISQMQKQGFPVVPFNFTTNKNSYYVSFRSFLNDGIIRIPKNDVLVREMKELRQEETKQAKLAIHKPTNGTDDEVASVIMACSPFLNDNKRGEVYVI